MAVIGDTRKAGVMGDPHGVNSAGDRFPLALELLTESSANFASDKIAAKFSACVDTCMAALLPWLRLRCVEVRLGLGEAFS